VVNSCLEIHVKQIKNYELRTKMRAFLRIFSHTFSNIFERFTSFFEYFTQLFEYFQTFLSTFFLPILPKSYDLTNQPPFLPQKPTLPRKTTSKNPVLR